MLNNYYQSYVISDVIDLPSAPLVVNDNDSHYHIVNSTYAMGKIMKKLGLYVVCATVAIVIPMSVVATDLETITVVGSRTERPLKEIAATIDVIDSDRIEEELARDIADLVRFEPGVTVSGTGSRFGLSGFNIRGIGGNRVLTLVLSLIHI